MIGFIAWTFCLREVYAHQLNPLEWTTPHSPRIGPNCYNMPTMTRGLKSNKSLGVTAKHQDLRTPFLKSICSFRLVFGSRIRAQQARFFWFPLAEVMLPKRPHASLS